MDRIAIIQLSDLQFGEKHSFSTPSTISKYLIHDIKTLSEKYKFEPYFLVLSGDISESSSEDEFDDAFLQISTLLDELSIDNDHLICIPGNHDINRELAKIPTSNIDLKYYNYNNFISSLKLDSQKIINRNYYPVLEYNRYGINFILINSSERNKGGEYIVNKELLLESINKIKNNNKFNIAILHHRVDHDLDLPKVKIENAREIESILRNNNINLILSGHVHECFVNKNNNSIYSGCGSTGVNKTQRVDGVPNQYSIYVLDYTKSELHSFFRSYNPRKESILGLGKWVNDNTFDDDFDIKKIINIDKNKTSVQDCIIDQNLVVNLKLRSNPFKYKNAEKIEDDRFSSMFVLNKKRHDGALSVEGDSIIRGPRGSGKTMLLKYLKIAGSNNLYKDVNENQSKGIIPVKVDFSSILKEEFNQSEESLLIIADNLVYDSVINTFKITIESYKSKKLSQKYSDFLIHLKQDDRDISKISKIGEAFRIYFVDYFTNIVLLIDEIATAFPDRFFDEALYINWLEKIRNSGPYFTKMAIYPNDKSDVLAEERYGHIVNLSYDLTNEIELSDFRKYAVELADKYLADYSTNKSNPVKLSDLIIHKAGLKFDAFEQLLFASGGSSRRLCTFLEKAVQDLGQKEMKKKLNKAATLKLIKHHAFTNLSSYNTDEKNIIEIIAQKCKRAKAFKFQMDDPNGFLESICSRKEELNIIRHVESISESKSTYEFTYAYCLHYDIPTHVDKKTNELSDIRNSKDCIWINKVCRLKFA